MGRVDGCPGGEGLGLRHQHRRPLRREARRDIRQHPWTRAQHVARQAKEAGAERLIHISGLGADPGSDSPYVRARGIGERLVKEAFDGVTILRPSVIFGPGDSFLNKLATMARQTPVLPLFGTGGTRLQPVFVGNVRASLREGAGRSLHAMPRLRTRRAAGLRLQGAGATGARTGRRANGPHPGPLPRVGPPGGRDDVAPPIRRSPAIR